MPALLVTATQPRTRPSDHVPVPTDVVDVMLWRMAFDVAVEHQRGPAGDCTNLRCAGQRGPCEPAIHAQRTLHAARQPATPPHRPQPDHVTPPRAPAVVGRATVPSRNTGRFTGWFNRTTTATPGRWGTSHLPQRIPGAALAA
ncbi:hypothetical protein ABT369_19520 [Dactylosporangium sp. NPDC000244]|uniref:hypothetical protein n=1 Tax=Dactylosporangium sp. NPDC000244 TaxID=3154365 RepID=UPI00331FF582